MKANNILKAKLFLEENQGYLKWGKEKLADKLNVSIHEIIAAKQMLWAEEDAEVVEPKDTTTIVLSANELDEFTAWRASKALTNVKEHTSPEPFVGGDPSNVLIIGDLHCPFDLDGYLEFCREQQEKFNCGEVIFIGDIIDGASWNFHTKNQDGMGQAEEISKAKKRLARWVKTFPVAKITLGNHDLLIARKMQDVGLSNAFMKEFGDIWGAPTTWTFSYEFLIDSVKYTHGHSGNAIKVAKESRISTVQGHLHSQAFTEWSVSEKDRIFGCQTGAGIDHKAYAFEYSRPFPKKPVIGCAVVLESGTLPINLLMNL